MHALGGCAHGQCTHAGPYLRSPSRESDPPPEFPPDVSAVEPSVACCVFFAVGRKRVMPSADSWINFR